MFKLARINRLAIKAALPTIELVAGGVLIAAGTVKLIHDAEKIAEVNNQARMNKEYRKSIDNDEDGWAGMDETRNHYILRTKKEEGVAYAKTTGIAVGMQLAGMGLVVLSHATLAKQLTAVSAALASTTTTFNNYRKRVIENEGEQKDYEYLTGNVLHTVTVEKDGTVTEQTIPVNTDSSINYIPHSFFWSETGFFTKDPAENLRSMRNILTYLNQRLERDGILTENDIRDYCTAKRTIAGQSSAIFYQNEDGTTNHLSFGLECNNDAAQRFRDGNETDFLVILQTDDHKPIESNMFERLKRDKKLNWMMY